MFEQLPCRWFFLAEKASFGVEESVDFFEERAGVSGESEECGIFGGWRFWKGIFGGSEEEDGEVCELGEGTNLGEEVVEMECRCGGVEEEEVWRALFCEAKGEVGLLGGGDVVGGASSEDAFERADAGGVGVEHEQEE